MRKVAQSRARMAQRPTGAGAQLLLVALMARAGISADALALVKPVCPTGPDLGQAVRSGRADCGIASRSVAHAAGLGFVPLVWECFDLALHQRDYFLPGPQALFEHLRTPVFRAQAAELQGYDVAEAAGYGWSIKAGKSSPTRGSALPLPGRDGRGAALRRATRVLT